MDWIRVNMLVIELCLTLQAWRVKDFIAWAILL